MSKAKALDFESEVHRHFGFLVRSYGMTGPESSNMLLPSVHYRGPDLLVSVVLETGDGPGTQISVGVTLLNRTWSARADLPDLVEAAVFAPRHLVPAKAHTADAARGTLAANATWLERLMPLLLGAEPDTLVRAAHERPVDRAGRPKKRPAGISWKYT